MKHDALNIGFKNPKPGEVRKFESVGQGLELGHQTVLRQNLTKPGLTQKIPAHISILLKLRSSGQPLPEGFNIGFRGAREQGPTNNPVRDRKEGTQWLGETMHRPQTGLSQTDA